MSFTTSLNLGKYKIFLKSLTEDQKQLVKTFRFGPLLDFDCSEALKYVSYMLAMRFDVKTRTVRLDNGSSFCINAFTVHQILGIPLGGHMIDTTSPKHAKQIVHSGIVNGKVAPSADYLINLVDKDLTGDKFVRVFMLITLTIFLCPTSSDKTSMHYYPGIAVVEDIPKFDWCTIVLDRLVQAIEKFQTSLAAGLSNTKQKKSSLGGCLYVLVVTYFEYIKTTGIQLPNGTPRIKCWDDNMIQQYLSLDGNSDDGHQFGLLQIKDPSDTPFTEPLPAVQDFSANQIPAAENSHSKDSTERPSMPPLFSDTAFSKLPAPVEDFIANLIPADEHRHLRGRLMDMCTKFHNEMMSSCLTAIQPVLTKQLCNMVEIMWVSLCKGANHVDDSIKQADTLPDMPGCSRRTVFGDGARGSTTLVDIGVCAQVDACQPKNTTQFDSNAVSSSLGTIQCAQKFRHKYCDSSSRDTARAPPCSARAPTISAWASERRTLFQAVQL